MHSRKRGNAGSKRPIKKSNPSWMSYKPKEVEMIITKLAKEGNSSSKIGIILRDTYGIPDIKHLLGKNLTKLLEEKKLTSKLPEDLMDLIKKSIRLRKHLEANHKDESVKRGLILTDSKIKRLVKYYKTTGKLSETWKYEPDRIRMYLE